MKKKLVVALVLAACCLPTTGLFAADSSTPDEVYINLDSVWRSSQQGKEDLAKIDATVKESQTDLEAQQEELKKLSAEFKAATTDEQKKEIAIQIEQKRRKLIETKTLREREIGQMKNQAQQKFVETIIPIVNKYRADNNIMVIHRFTANDVVSIDPKVDITEEILDIYGK